jgi:hypothetical protein
VQEAQSGDSRHRQSNETDEQVDADGAVRIEREDRDQQRQSELRTAQTDQATEYGHSRTCKGCGQRSTNGVETLGSYHAIRSPNDLGDFPSIAATGAPRSDTALPSPSQPVLATHGNRLSPCVSHSSTAG